MINFYFLMGSYPSCMVWLWLLQSYPTFMRRFGVIRVGRYGFWICYSLCVYTKRYVGYASGLWSFKRMCSRVCVRQTDRQTLNMLILIYMSWIIVLILAMILPTFQSLYPFVGCFCMMVDFVVWLYLGLNRNWFKKLLNKRKIMKNF